MARRKPQHVLVAVFGVALIVGSGCGGGSSGSGGGAAASSTKAEFVRKGDGICRTVEKQLAERVRAYARRHGLTANRPPSRAQAAEIGRTILIPGVEREVGEIRALRAPANEGARVDGILAAVEAGVATVRKDPASLMLSRGEPFAKANRLAGEFGLEVCGAN